MLPPMFKIFNGDYDDKKKSAELHRKAGCIFQSAYCPDQYTGSGLSPGLYKMEFQTDMWIFLAFVL